MDILIDTLTPNSQDMKRHVELYYNGRKYVVNFFRYGTVYMRDCTMDRKVNEARKVYSEILTHLA